MKKQNGIQQHLQEIGGSVLRMNIHGKNRQLLVAANRWAIFKKKKPTMKPETLQAFEISNKDKRVFGNFMYGFQNWLVNDQMASKYLSKVKNFGASVVEFWLPDDSVSFPCPWADHIRRHKRQGFPNRI